ncbi:MAG: hypothetical protein A2857_00695 [Candidatus Levybacteria bacterium RIFCSPHIGHO2_01_FULL_36_15]|nr:MAG: hypothetical protein A2857_00695 [Candidatus Levybacteria bacterium RIFCSPHIGHO2_01_FULL_36_15]
MTKYQKYFQEMLSQNKEVFDSFKILHDAYAVEPEKWQKKFNEEGEKVMEIIRRYEKMLCNNSDSSGYSKFSSKLADKFWEAVRNQFPKIDFVGLQ